MATIRPKMTGRLANPIETASTAGGSFVANELKQTSKIAKDQFSGIGDDFFSQLLGLDFGAPEKKPQKRMSGEMKQGEEVSLTELSITARLQPRGEYAKKPEMKPSVLPGLDYRSEIVHAGERLSRKESRELEKQIREIMEELKRVVNSSSILAVEFAELSVETAPTSPGKYHLNFFEWLLIEIRKIRMKVEDAGAWLSVMKSKKSQRKYGAMAKKHGTSFTLSNERTTATQTG